MPKILIADDHSMVRKGLIYQCRIELGYQDLREVSNCNHLMETLKNADYSHLILDIVLSDGSSLDIIEAIRNLYPTLSILIFSAKTKAIYGPALSKYGIWDFVEKDSNELEIMQKLRTFLGSAGPNKYKNIDSPTPSVFSKLTRRELEVLHYWLEGFTTRAIAGKLNMSDQAVSTYKSRLYEKTNTHSIKELEQLVALYNIKD